MLCKNCGSTVDRDLTTCPKCGNDLSASTIQTTAFDINELKKQPDIIAAGFALIFCFLPWVNMQTFMVKMGFSSMNLSTPFMTADSIFAPALLYFLPICLLGIVASAFVPKLKAYKRIFLLVSVGLLLYSAIGLYQLLNPAPQELPESSTRFGRIMQMAQNYAQGEVKNAYSIGFGFYLTFIAVGACAFFYGLSRLFKTKKRTA